MRYFLDTEYDGWAGALISLALVAESDEELYLVLDHRPLDPWVERHVMPYLDTVPEPLRSPRLSRAAAAEALAFFLAGDPDPLILADWPEDIAQLSMLLVTGPGTMVAVPALRFQLIALPGFSTAANSAVPHNALHDARALRDHLSSLG
ncbi:MAG: hypothetical protein ABIS23_01335 [Sphingomicrobium sp.]